MTVFVILNDGAIVPEYGYFENFMDGWDFLLDAGIEPISEHIVIAIDQHVFPPTEEENVQAQEDA